MTSKRSSPILDPPSPKPTVPCARLCCSRRRTVCPKHWSITSAGPAEGKSLTSMCIAKHFATVGRKVLLIDADLRNPSLHMKLGLRQFDWTQQLSYGRVHAARGHAEDRYPELGLHRRGPLPPNAADLLGGRPPALIAVDRLGGFRSHRHRWASGLWASLMRSYCRALPQRRSSLSVRVKYDQDSLRGALRHLQLSRGSAHRCGTDQV